MRCIAGAAALIGGVIAAMAGPASAATIIYKGSIDLSRSTPNNEGWLIYGLPFQRLWAKAGDVIAGELTFAGNKALYVTPGSNILFLTMFGDPGSMTSIQRSLRFTGVSAGYTGTPSFDGVTHSRNLVLSTSGPWTQSGFSFTGIAFTATITATTSLSFQPSTMIVRADQRVIPGPSAVPEPAAWALMIGGFALAGGALRRQSVTCRSLRAG